jgi:hypothetical protein
MQTPESNHLEIDEAQLRLDWARYLFAIGLSNSSKCLSNSGKPDPCHRINKAFHLKLVGLEGLLSTSNQVCIYAPVKEWQKRATLGAVFGAPSTAPNPPL